MLNKQTGRYVIGTIIGIFIYEVLDETQLFADSVEKQRVAGAESVVLTRARAPFLSGFTRLLRCRKDLG